MIDVGPADVLAVDSGGTGFFDKMIRIGALLQGKPDESNHVVIVTHQDPTGRWIGIEGRPSSVGVVDVTKYLSNALTRSNHTQPRPDDAGQVAEFLGSCAKSLGIAYDWVGIAEDTFDSLDLHDVSGVIDHLWRWPTGGAMPGHVVCSSLAAMLYGQVGWAHPDTGLERECEPADWWKWNDTQAWQS